MNVKQTICKGALILNGLTFAASSNCIAANWDNGNGHWDYWRGPSGSGSSMINRTNNGEVNIIISAPHGGTRNPTGNSSTWPFDRILDPEPNSSKDAITTSDGNTHLIAQELVDKLHGPPYNLKVHGVVSRVKRRYVDFNRRPPTQSELNAGEKLIGHSTKLNSVGYSESEGKVYYDVYHDEIENKINSIVGSADGKYSKAIVIDIHGHARTDVEYKNPNNGNKIAYEADRNLLMRGTFDGRSIESLVDAFGWGAINNTDRGLLGYLWNQHKDNDNNANGPYNDFPRQAGAEPFYRILPWYTQDSDWSDSVLGRPESFKYPTTSFVNGDTSRPYEGLLTGGYITKQYGSMNNDDSNAIQLELGSNLRGYKFGGGSSSAARATIVNDLAETISNFYDKTAKYFKIEEIDARDFADESKPSDGNIIRKIGNGEVHYIKTGTASNSQWMKYNVKLHPGMTKLKIWAKKVSGGNMRIRLGSPNWVSSIGNLATVTIDKNGWHEYEVPLKTELLTNVDFSESQEVYFVVRTGSASHDQSNRNSFQYDLRSFHFE